MFSIGDEVVIWDKEAAESYCIPIRLLDKVFTIGDLSGGATVGATDIGGYITWRIPIMCLRHRGEVIFEETMS